MKKLLIFALAAAALLSALALAEGGTPSAARELPLAVPGAEAAEGYRVVVIDGEGNPVEGAVVQFCGEETCTMAKTDAEGVAAFDLPEAPGYTVHILAVPEGFEGDDAEYAAPEVYGEISVVLDRAQ